MPIEVHLPRVTQTAEKASITRWLKAEGDRVAKGDILFEMETDKANVEVEAPEPGILGQILLPEGKLAPIGHLAALIFAEGEQIQRQKPAAAPRMPMDVREGERAGKEIPADLKRDIRATPLAKRMARELGIDLGTIQGSGPDGRIEKQDVERARDSGASQRVEVRRERIVPLTGTRETIARRMTQSFQTAPHFYLSLEADMKKMLELRESMEGGARGRKPTYTDMIVKVVAQVLKEFPRVNSTWTEEGIELKEEIHIGVAVESGAGLVVPVVKNADVQSLIEISEILFQLVQKSRDRKLGIEELTGGTFTVTNMGMLGIERFDAIINPPESAILSVGKVVEKAVVMDGGIHIRPRMDLTLSVDHRVLDGSEAARFLVRIKERIEDPAGLR
jgi:pyruvate dehydrogenase E2 component (dihydrolipoamide acetyltransferase)